MSLKRVLEAAKRRPPNFSDPADLLEAFRQLCAHMSEGKSHKSFVFYKDGKSLTGQRIVQIVEEKPELFTPSQIEAAYNEAYSKWESTVFDHSKIPSKESNPAIIQMIMRNMFDWDKTEKVVQENPQTNVTTIRYVDSE